jgi:selenoprotein W-related protein
LADELLRTFPLAIAAVTLIPSGGGRFEVIANDTLIYSKLAEQRHAEPGEVARRFAENSGVNAQATP